MIKKMCCLGSAVLGVIALSACGSTNSVAIDQSKIWLGGNNAVQTGGYWFSYTDHVQWMKDNAGWVAADHAPQTGATITPLTSLKVSMPIVQDSDTTSGHGDVIHVTGNTPAPPAWDDVIRSANATHPGGWFDTYYQQADLYPDSLITAYPVAGVGFGFLHNNATPYDPSQGGKYVGVVFDMKTAGNTVSVDTQLSVVCGSTDGDDLNDPTFSDGFPKPGCVYAKMTTKGEDLAAQGADYNAQHLDTTCFGYEHKMYTMAPADDGKWKTYCVLWNELQLADFINKPPPASIPAWNDDTLQKCTSKLKWEMDKTAAGTNVSNFDVTLDNIQVITRAQAADPKYNCTVANLPADATKLIGPTAGGDAG